MLRFAKTGSAGKCGNHGKVGQKAGSLSLKGSEKWLIARLTDERENNLAYLNSIKGHTSAKSNVFI